LTVENGFMISIYYDLPETLRRGTIGPPLLAPFVAAQDAISQLHGRTERSPLREAWMQRLLFEEACACQLAEGDLVHLEDLVLMDGHAYAGPPSMALSSALEILKTWRAAGRDEAPDALQAPRPGMPGCSALPASASEAGNEHAPVGSPPLVEAWRRVQLETRDLPPLIAAAVAWDAWLALLPESRSAWRATLLAALTLRARGAASHLLLPLDIGWRVSSYRQRADDDLATRIAGFLGWAEAAATEARKAFDSLVLAEGLLRKSQTARRSSSRMPGLAELLVKRPFVSVALAARELKITRQAADKLLKKIGAPAHKLTDRKRCNVWSIIG
jgi:hypothetical protein